jgi:hypothetical protein
LRWDLCVGQAITGGTWTDVNTTYSGIEVNTGATLSGAPAIVIDSGWVSVGGNDKGVTNIAVISRYPITLDAAGLNRTMGSLTLKVTSLSGTPVVYGGIKFREIRLNKIFFVTLNYARSFLKKYRLYRWPYRL